MNSVKYKRQGVKQADAYEAVGFKSDARDFSAAGKILKNLGVKSIKMLTNNPDKVKTVSQYGVEVVGTRDIVL